MFNILISDQILPQEQQINLKCFRNLFSLELDLVPIHQLKGLQNLRPVLRYLIVRGVCSQVSEILLKCGADKVRFTISAFTPYLLLELSL